MDGYNHDWLGQLPGKKFRKAFCRKDNVQYGFNQVVMQDGQGYIGVWRVQMTRGKPLERGFSGVTLVQEEPPYRLSAPYRHLAYFNYG